MKGGISMLKISLFMSCALLFVSCMFFLLKDKAINEIRAMSNFIGRIGHKVTEYHSIEEREKLVK